MALPLSVTIRSGAPTNDFTSLHLFNNYRFPSSAIAPVCKSRRLYPGCSSIFWQPANSSTITKVNSVETILCIVSFYIGTNYRDLIAALSVRSTLTDSPVASFTTLLLRATQHATGLMVKVARFSHREAYSHRNSSLAGHTHCIAKIGAGHCNFDFGSVAALVRADRFSIGH